MFGSSKHPECTRQTADRYKSLEIFAVIFIRRILHGKIDIQNKLLIIQSMAKMLLRWCKHNSNNNKYVNHCVRDVTTTVNSLNFWIIQIPMGEVIRNAVN